MSTMKAQLTIVTQVLTSQMAQGQVVDPALLDAIVPLQSQHRKSSVASTQLDNDDDDQVVEPPRYPPWMISLRAVLVSCMLKFSTYPSRRRSASSYLQGLTIAVRSMMARSRHVRWEPQEEGVMRTTVSFPSI